MIQPTVYLITGSTGIAAATAKLAVQVGITVFFTSRTAENCQRLFVCCCGAINHQSPN